MEKVIFRKGYTSEALIAVVHTIETIDGKDTDLHIDKPVFAIHFVLENDCSQLLNTCKELAHTCNELEGLKCCGNCKFWRYSGIQKYCTRDKDDLRIKDASAYCKNWVLRDKKRQGNS